MAVKVTGVNELMSHLMAFGQEAEQGIIDEVEDAATSIEIKAIRNKGAKLSFITIDKIFTNGGLRAVVGVQGENLLAVYFEFGTGLSAKQILAPYPQEVKDLAMQYFITGEGNLRGQPYLFPAYFEENPKFIKALEDLLKELTIKYSKS